MAGVYERVRAMPVIAEMWPSELAAESDFAGDPTPATISTYVAARILILEAMRWLQASAQLGEDPRAAQQGAHILLLRPALVSTAKCAWVVRPEDGNERASRASRLAAQDRGQGAAAMEKAAEMGAPAAFAQVGQAFARARKAVVSTTPLTGGRQDRPPSDEKLIRELGGDIDNYYGSVSGRSDLQLLWNAASSLAHGERWYGSLTGGTKRKAVADALTERSTDAVCSAINVTHLRILRLALSRPTPPPGPPHR